MTKIEITNEVEAFKIRTVKTCSACSDLMVDGFYNEETEEYFCQKECIEKHFTPEEQEEAFEFEIMFYTQWFDVDVFEIFNSQYAHYEDAIFILQKHGDMNTKIYAKEINLGLPVFSIKNGEQITFLD